MEDGHPSDECNGKYIIAVTDWRPSKPWSVHVTFVHEKY